MRRRGFDRRARWPVLAALVIAGGAAVLVLRPDGSDQATDATTTTAPPEESFTVEGEDGTLTFEQDEDDATLEFGEEDSDGRFSFDLDGDGAVTEGDSGTFQLTQGEPEGWPSDFPVPDEATALRGSVVDAGPLVQLSTTYGVPHRPEEILAFYREALSEVDPVVSGGATDEGFEASVSFEGRWTGFITVQAAAEGTEIGAQLLVEGTP